MKLLEVYAQNEYNDNLSLEKQNLEENLNSFILNILVSLIHVMKTTSKQVNKGA